jgi:hypothetical protein
MVPVGEQQEPDTDDQNSPACLEMSEPVESAIKSPINPPQEPISDTASSPRGPVAASASTGQCRMPPGVAFPGRSAVVGRSSMANRCPVPTPLGVRHGTSCIPKKSTTCSPIVGQRRSSRRLRSQTLPSSLPARRRSGPTNTRDTNPRNGLLPAGPRTQARPTRRLSSSPLLAC